MSHFYRIRTFQEKAEKNLLDEELKNINRHIDDLSTILIAQWNSISQAKSQAPKEVPSRDVIEGNVAETDDQPSESYLERYFSQEMG